MLMLTLTETAEAVISFINGSWVLDGNVVQDLSCEFVMDHENKIYLSNHLALRDKTAAYGKTIFHSGVLNGSPVKAAGMLRIQNGKLVHISNLSGHYKPGDQQTYNILTHLQKMGFDLSTLKWRDRSYVAIPAIQKLSALQAQFA